jgi:hypothetical protein
MAKQNKFKGFLSDMKDLYKYVFNHIWQDKDPGINIIQHFITIAGTAALGIGAATCVTAGTILPAVLLGLGTAATATDEIYHLIKRENSPIIARTISNLVGTVLAPPLLLVMYPVALAISATFDFFKGVKENIQNKFFDRKSPTAEKDLEQEHDNVTTPEATIHTPTPEATIHAPELTNSPTSAASNENLDLNNYYLDEDEQQLSDDNVEELSAQQNNNPTHHE